MRPTIRSILAGLCASSLLLMIELYRLLRLHEGEDASGLGFMADVGSALLLDHLTLAFLAAAFVLAVSSARSLVKSRKWRHTLPAIAASPIFFWVGLELAAGSGVMRAGLRIPVIMGIPLLGFFGIWILAFVLDELEKFAGGKLGAWPSAILLLVLGLTVGYVNREVYVGLYIPVHEALQIFELFAATLFFHLFILPSPRTEEGRESGEDDLEVRPVGGKGLRLNALAGLLIGLGLAFQGLSIWPVGKAPAEDMRSLYTRFGFYSASILNWRARLAPLEIDDGSIDESLEERIRNWNTLSASLEEELDRRLPDRRISNLLFISIDTLRPDRLGCYGNPDGLTPNIDALAKEATVFETAYSQYPSTALSTESFFHGRYPRATAIYRKNKGELSQEDQPGLRISELARLNRVRTAAAIAFTKEWMESPLFSLSLEQFDLVNPDRKGAPRLDGEYFADSAMSAMKELERERFFLWFHLFDPHHPYELRPGYARSDDATGRYDGEVRYADEQLGRVIAFMKERGLWDNTVIVLTSDHGEAFGEKGGIRYHGSSLQEAQIRIPLLIRVPGLPGQRVPEIAENVDLYQTITTLLALEGGSPNQGSDLTPLLIDRDRFAAKFPNFGYAELPDDVAELSSASTQLASLREGQWKLIRHYTTQFSELYNVVDDPKETRDLSEQETVVKLRMEKRLRTLNQWTSNFGRRLTQEEFRRRNLEKAKTSLRHDDPYENFEGLSFVEENDLRELAGFVRAMATDESEYPELRTRALRMLAAWNEDVWPQLALDWLTSDNPVFRWVAGWILLDEMNRIAIGSGRIAPENARAVLAAASGWQLPEPLQLMAAALRLSSARVAGVEAQETSAADLEMLRAAADDPLIEKDLRTSLILAMLDRLPEPLRKSALFDETDLRYDFLETLWVSGRRDAWLEFARELLPDRYLPARLKSRILEIVLDDFTDDVVKEVGVLLLARWDPSFHDEVTRKLLARFDPATVRDLQRCHGRISDGRDLLATGNHAAAVEAFAAATAMIGKSQASLSVDLDRLRSLIALDRWDDARALKDGLLERARDCGSASLLHRAIALISYLEGEEGLSAKSKIRVESVDVSRGDAGWVEVGGKFDLEVVIRNDDDRPLLGGPFKHGGRLRVLWDAPAGKEPIYGSEGELGLDLLPGESRRLVLRVAAPDAPGIWKARVIVNEHQGARFHVVEDESAVFQVHVGRPHLGPPEGLWGPLKVARAFRFDPSLEGLIPSPDDESLFIVAESYEGAFRSPPLGFNGQSRRLTIRGRWWSGVPEANLVRIELKPLAGFDAVAPTFAEISWGGEEFLIEADLPAAVGLYLVELRIGYRQGLLELKSIRLE